MRIIKSYFNKNVLLIEPIIHKDTRGYFYESFNKIKFNQSGIKDNFIQDNFSKSIKKLTLRGIHYQLKPNEQSKFVRVINGEIIDYVVDLRIKSKTFGKSISIKLNDKKICFLYIPRGFGHGFLTLKKNTIIHYKVSGKYSPTHAKVIKFNDPILNLNLGNYKFKDFTLSNNDKIGLSLKEFKIKYKNKLK